MQPAAGDAGGGERDDEGGDAVAAGDVGGADRGGHVLAPEAVGDPLLGAVDDVGVGGAVEDGGGGYVGDVGAGWGESARLVGVDRERVVER